MPEVRTLPSASVTRFRQYYDPLRLLCGPPCLPRRWVLPDHDRSPPITRIALPMCRAHYPGGSDQVHMPGFLPCSVLPSPLHRRVGIRITTFEACSDFTHVTARWLAQPPKGDLCHKAPARPVTRTSRLSATRSNRLLSRWNLPPLATRAYGAHCATARPPAHRVRKACPRESGDRAARFRTLRDLAARFCTPSYVRCQTSDAQEPTLSGNAREVVLR